MLKRYRFLIVLSLCVASYGLGRENAPPRIVEKPIIRTQYVKIYQPLKHQSKHDQINLLASAIPATALTKGK